MTISESKELFAEVAIPAYVQQTYTYRIPGVLTQYAQCGCRVAVPFGKALQVGFVVALHDTLESDIPAEKIKDIEEWIDDEPVITEELLELTHWVADYYYAPWGEVLKAALPSGLNATPRTRLTVTESGLSELETQTNPPHLTKWQFLKFVVDAGGSVFTDQIPAAEYSEARVKAIARELDRTGHLKIQHALGKQKVQAKRQNVVRLLPSTAGTGGEVKKPTETQMKVVRALEADPNPVPLTTLTQTADVTPGVIRTMAQKGLVEIFTREIRRDPLAYLKSLPRRDSVQLNQEQAAALAAITAAFAKNEYACFLLHGVTGSGKTEVYLNAMQAVLEQGRSALMLVPEIGLTPMFARRLAERFGDLVAILHSSLSDGERLDEWERIRAGEAQVVIGTRSAIFAPLVNLGLIVVDEEHDTSYKQAETPRYHGRDTAIMRAHRAKCPIILGSATPAIESAQNAVNEKYRKLELTERFEGRALPTVEVVDMREVFKRHGKQQPLSDELLTALKEAKERGEQTMILLNRRGFSSFLLCRSCGASVQCPNCDVALTYHKADLRLVCHYCNHHAPVPKQCPNCQGSYIYYVGEGTEQLEELLKNQFPEYRIARLDRDTTRRRGAFERVLGEFASGGLDVLVGTQMIAKGHDFPNVTLVGVVSVDAGLGMPDFRASERTFQLLAQVAGRAGRGELPGKVILQTYHPEHYALQCAKKQDYRRFYEQEIQFRRDLYYPPFSVLANVIIRHTDATHAVSLAEQIGKFLRAAAQGDASVRVLGPASAPLAKLKNEYRHQILLKSRSRRKLRDVLDLAFSYLADATAARTGKAITPDQNPERRFISVEIDPVDLM
ncbi:MAG: primosomal protein N' [Blastocatellia bacterium]|nr:primosomal protein N' [Blastocatellia bacterium]